MTKNSRIAKKELAKKLSLETKLKRKLTKIFNEMSRLVQSNFSEKGILPDLSKQYLKTEKAILSHYYSVTNSFSNHFRDRHEINLKDDLLIDERLDTFIKETAPVRSSIINSTTKKRLDKIEIATMIYFLKNGISSDKSKLARHIKRSFVKDSKSRVGTIALTETQLPAESTKHIESLEVIAASHIVKDHKKEWVTVGDSKVREAHAIADGQIVDVRSKFQVGGEMLRYPADWQNGSAWNVINCLHPSSVIDFASPNKITRRWYVGKMISIKLASGNNITVTTNHPILGNNGFIKAQEIIKGQKIVSCNFLDIKSSNHNIKNRKPTIEQIFSSFGKSFVSVGGIDTIVNFHGDISDKDVDIIGMDGCLLDAWETKFSDPFSKLIFSDSDECFIPISSYSTKFFILNRAKMFISKFLRFLMRPISLMFSFIIRHVAPLKKFCFTSCSGRNIINSKDFINSGSCETSFFRNLIDRFSRIKIINNTIKMFSVFSSKNNLTCFAFGSSNVFNDDIDSSVCCVKQFFDFCERESIDVCVSDVADITHFNYSGYVYNLEDNKSYYICNGIVNHNCRCTAIYFK